MWGKLRLSQYIQKKDVNALGIGIQYIKSHLTNTQQ